MKSFAQALANQMVADNPQKYTANMSKAKRQGKVYIDYLRNGRGATFIVPFSTRARPNAPVSTPLAWNELSDATDPAGWTLHTIEARLKKVKDPWRDMNGVRQSITAAMMKALGV